MSDDKLNLLPRARGLCTDVEKFGCRVTGTIVLEDGQAVTVHLSSGQNDPHFKTASLKITTANGRVWPDEESPAYGKIVIGADNAIYLGNSNGKALTPLATTAYSKKTNGDFEEFPSHRYLANLVEKLKEYLAPNPEITNRALTTFPGSITI